VTAPPENAADLPRPLVEERLAACVNRFPCESVYRREGEVFAEDEVVLLAKPTVECYPALGERVRESHPHDVPCTECFDEADVDAPFADLRRVAVADGQGTG